MRQANVAIALVAFVCAPVAFGDDKKIISPAGAKPGGNYSQGIMADGTLYISGQVGEGADGKIPSDFDMEVRQSLDNIGAVQKGAGMSPSYFKPPRPTRTTVIVSPAGGVRETLRLPLSRRSNPCDAKLKT